MQDTPTSGVPGWRLHRGRARRHRTGGSICALYVRFGEQLRLGGLASVRITYDQQSDAATIHLAGDIPSGGAPRSLMTDLEVKEGAVILLLNADDQLVGIEVLGASK